MMAIPGQDLSDFSMMDLFRSEVEAHTATLSDGLLELEDDPSARENIESLMRAAHSIKGGARIVELDAAVKIAHTMEDCFVAAQKGEVSLTSDHIDTLLQGVDMLSQISESVEDSAKDWLASHQDGIERLVSAIAGILEEPEPSEEKKEPEPEPEETKEQPRAEEPPAEDKPEKPEMIAPDSVQLVETEPPTAESKPSQMEPDMEMLETRLLTPTEKAEPAVSTGTGAHAVQELGEARPTPDRPSEKERMLRVTATKIERLMGLAGEVVVSTRWLPPYYQSLLSLKKSHVDLLNLLEKLQETLVACGSNLAGDLAFLAQEKTKECNQNLLDRMNHLDKFISASENLSDRLYHEIIGVRMCPFSDGLRGFPRMVRDLAKELGKKVKLKVLGDSTEVDRDILEKLEAPLSHLLRNALDHGIETPEERLAAGKPETGIITLEAAHRSGMLMITIADDGKGIHLDHLREKVLEKVLTNAEMVNKLSESELMDFLFLPGFSTVENITEISGRGVGLDVVHSMVHDVGGVIRAVSEPGKGLTFQLELPLTLSVIRTFLVEIANEPYAFPLARIDRSMMLPKESIEMVEDRQYFRLGLSNISLVDIHDVLELQSPAKRQKELPIVIISDRMHQYGLVVDKFLGECDLVVRPLDARLGKVPDIAAAAVMLDGSPVLILDVEDLVRSIDNLLTGKERLHKIGDAGGEDSPDVKGKKRVLVVDDSITVREMERKLLENNGYQVEVAVDGMDGWNMLRTGHFDMVVSDIDMPRMNGIELIDQIKQHDKYKTLPVVVVSYKNKEEDRLRGLQAGANYYLTKSSFQDNSFINAVVDLIGEP